METDGRTRWSCGPCSATSWVEPREGWRCEPLFGCAIASPAKLPAMNRFVRSLVMWLLVLAPPVQGFAVSTILLCGAGHHGAARATGAEHDHAGHMDMGASGTTGASGSHADHDHEAAATPAHDGKAPGSMAAKHANVMGKCSACAACCTVAFLPTTIVAFAAPAPRRVLPVVELTAHVGFVADGPDKPPRLFLA